MAYLSIRHKTSNYFPIGHHGSVELNIPPLKHSANRTLLTGVRTRSACILVQFSCRQVHWIFELAMKIFPEVKNRQKFISFGVPAEGYVCSAMKSADYHFLSHPSLNSVQPVVFSQKMSITNGQLFSTSFEVSKLKAPHYFFSRTIFVGNGCTSELQVLCQYEQLKVTKMHNSITTEKMD